MELQLKRVAGGWAVFIPDAVAAGIGITETSENEVLVMGEELVVRCPEHRRQTLERMIASITPEMIHGPYEGLQPENERVSA